MIFLSLLFSFYSTSNTFYIEKKLLRVGIYYSQGNLSEAGNILEDLTSEELEDDDNSSSISATNTYVYENNEYKYIMDMYSTIEKALVRSFLYSNFILYSLFSLFPI